MIWLELTDGLWVKRLEHPYIEKWVIPQGRTETVPVGDRRLATEIEIEGELVVNGELKVEF